MGAEMTPTHNTQNTDPNFSPNSTFYDEVSTLPTYKDGDEALRAHDEDEGDDIIFPRATTRLSSRYQSNSSSHDISVQSESGHSKHSAEADIVLDEEEDEASTIECAVVIYALSTLLVEGNDALLMRLAMHFESVCEVMGRVVVLSETLTTEEVKEVLERLMVDGEREWRKDLEAVIGSDHEWTTDVMQIIGHLGVEKEEVLMVTNNTADMGVRKYVVQNEESEGTGMRGEHFVYLEEHIVPMGGGTGSSE